MTRTGLASRISGRTPKHKVLEFRLSKVGFPIRKSADQSFFAAPHGFSQRSTSFIASQRQGIHRMPLRHLIALMLNAHSPTLARGPGHCSERPVSCLDSSVTPQPSSQAPLPKEQTDESLFTMSKNSLGTDACAPRTLRLSSLRRTQRSSRRERETKTAASRQAAPRRCDPKRSDTGRETP